jgi:sugar phosphate isomerase/epimerase
MSRASALKGSAAAVLGRRDLLKAAAAALLASRPIVALADDARTKAKKNVTLGIHAFVYSKLPVREAAARIKAAGLSSVLTDFCFADTRFDPLAPDWQAVKTVRQAFDEHGIHIAAVEGYANITAPNDEKRKRNLARIEALLVNWKRLGCANVSTESGTLSTHGDWDGAPENATEAGYQKCRAAVEQLVRQAEKSGAVLSIEPYWPNVIGTIERAARLFRDVPSPSLKLVMDPSNYFSPDNISHMRPMLEDMFRQLGARIAVAHAHDVRAVQHGDDSPAAGQGLLDYPLFLRLLGQLDRPIDLLLEHLTEAEVPRTRDFVLAQFAKI